MSWEDKILLRKRCVIESVNDELKNVAQIEHSRHRSIANFLLIHLPQLRLTTIFPRNHH